MNGNKIKFIGTTMANVRLDGTELKLPLLITGKETNPLLGLNWRKNLKITIMEEEGKTVQQIEESDDLMELKEKFHKLVRTNTTIKYIKVDIILKPGEK